MLKLHLSGAVLQVPQHRFLSTCTEEPAIHRIIVVQQLIKSGANVNAKNNNHYTALMFAVMHGRGEEIIQQLIESGTNVDIKSTTGWTALMLALDRGKKQIVQLLTDSHEIAILSLHLIYALKGLERWTPRKFTFGVYEYGLTLLDKIKAIIDELQS